MRRTRRKRKEHWTDTFLFIYSIVFYGTLVYLLATKGGLL